MCSSSRKAHPQKGDFWGSFRFSQCLFGWSANLEKPWYQKHHNDIAGRNIPGQGFSFTWCLQLRKEDKAEVLLRCKHPSLVLHTQTAMPGQNKNICWATHSPVPPAPPWNSYRICQLGWGLQAGKLCLLWGHSHLSLLLSRNHHTNVMITQSRALRNKLLEFNDDSKLGKTAANKPCSRLYKDWGLGWSQNQKYHVPFGSWNSNLGLLNQRVEVNTFITTDEDISPHTRPDWHWCHSITFSKATFDLCWLVLPGGDSPPLPALPKLPRACQALPADAPPQIAKARLGFWMMCC